MAIEKRTGGCLCGKVRYAFDTDAVISGHHCHCTDCQKSTGSGKATMVFVVADKLKIDGTIKYFTVTGTDGAEVSRGFCEECGSPLISYLGGLDAMKIIKAGSLDDSSWINIQSSFWSASAAPWSPVDEAVPSVSGNPEL